MCARARNINEKNIDYTHQVSQRVHHDEVNQPKKSRQATALRPKTRPLHERHTVVCHDAIGPQEAVHHLV